jgi:hypothetical protein
LTLHSHLDCRAAGRNHRLKDVEAIVGREQRVPAAGDNNRFSSAENIVNLGSFGPVAQSRYETDFYSKKAIS